MKKSNRPNHDKHGTAGPTLPLSLSLAKPLYSFPKTDHQGPFPYLPTFIPKADSQIPAIKIPSLATLTNMSSQKLPTHSNMDLPFFSLRFILAEPFVPVSVSVRFSHLVSVLLNKGRPVYVTNWCLGMVYLAQGPECLDLFIAEFFPAECMDNFLSSV